VIFFAAEVMPLKNASQFAVIRAVALAGGWVASHPDRDEGLNSGPTPVAWLTIGPMTRLWPAAR